MKSCIDSLFDESERMFNPDASCKNRLLTDAEIQELLCDLPVHVIAFCRETPRTHIKIA